MKPAFPDIKIIGYEAGGWKPFTLFDGTPCLVPGDFNVTPAPDGGWLMFPQGDLTAPAAAQMTKGEGVRLCLRERRRFAAPPQHWLLRKKRDEKNPFPGSFEKVTDGRHEIKVWPVGLPAGSTH